MEKQISSVREQENKKASGAGDILISLRHSAFMTDAEQKVIDRAAKILFQLAHNAKKGNKQRD